MKCFDEAKHFFLDDHRSDKQRSAGEFYPREKILKDGMLEEALLIEAENQEKEVRDLHPNEECTLLLKAIKADIAKLSEEEMHGW